MSLIEELYAEKECNCINCKYSNKLIEEEPCCGYWDYDKWEQD